MDIETTQEERGKKGVEQHQKRKVQIKTSVEGKSSDGGNNLAMTKEGGKEERHGANRSQKGMRRRGREVSPEESSSDISDFCDVKQRRRVARSGQKRARKRYDDSEDEFDSNEENRQGFSRERTRGENDVNNYRRKLRESPRQIEYLDVPKEVDRVTRSEGKRTKETYDNSEDEYETNEDNRQRVSREGARGENDVKIYKRKSRKASREAEDDDIPKGGDGVTRSRVVMIKSSASDSEVSPSLFDESDEDRTKEKAGKTTQTRTSSGQGCSSNKSLQKKSSRIAGPSGKDNRQKDVTPKKRSSNKTRRSNDSFSEGLFRMFFTSLVLDTVYNVYNFGSTRISNATIGSASFD